MSSSDRAARRRAARKQSQPSAIHHTICKRCDRRTYCFEPARLCESCLLAAALKKGLIEDAE